MVKCRLLLNVLLLLAIPCLAALPGLAAAEPVLKVEVAPESGSMDDDFMFLVKIDGAANSAYPLLSGGDDFTLRLIGPQSSVSIINGKVTQSVVYKYSLTPKKAGVLDTPSIEVELDGKKLTAEALKVTVQETQGDVPSKPKDVFLRQSLSKSEVWIGEQVIRNLEVFSRVRVHNAAIDNDALDGFWSEAIEGEKRYERVLGADRYSVTQMRKALWPIRSGEIELPARKLSAQVPDSRRQGSSPFGFDPFNQDLFDDFFGNTRVRVMEAVSNSPVLKVKPLPPPPAGFPDWAQGNAIVGETTVDLDFTPGPIKTGESKTISVTVKTTGNLSPVKTIPLERTDSFRVYEEAPASSLVERNGELLSTRTFRLSILALKSGKVRIPPFRFGYFDPVEGAYGIAETAPLNFEVLPSESSERDSQSSNRPEASTSQPPASTTAPQAPFSERSAWEKMASRLSGSAVALGLSIFLVLFLVLALLLAQRRHTLPLRLIKSKIKQASRTADLSSAFREALWLKLDAQAHDSIMDLRALINSRLSPEASFEANSILDVFDPALYGGSELSQAELERLKSRCLDLLRR